MLGKGRSAEGTSSLDGLDEDANACKACLGTAHLVSTHNFSPRLLERVAHFHMAASGMNIALPAPGLQVAQANGHSSFVRTKHLDATSQFSDAG